MKSARLGMWMGCSSANNFRQLASEVGPEATEEFIFLTKITGPDGAFLPLRMVSRRDSEVWAHGSNTRMADGAGAPQHAGHGSGTRPTAGPGRSPADPCRR